VIATKHDKVKSGLREKRKRELATGCGLAPADILWVSAAKGTNVDRLRSQMVAWLTP
jgi:GTP-binding protein